MQHQQVELKAEFLDDQKNPPFINSSPIQIIDESNKQIEEQIEVQQQPHIKYSYQQQMAVPAINMIGQKYPSLQWSIEQLENALRSYTNFFCGCNLCFQVLAFYFQIGKLIIVVDIGQIAAMVMFLISQLCHLDIRDLSFVLNLIFLLQSFRKQQEKLLFWNQIFLLTAIIFQVIGSIIIFVTYNQEQDHTEFKGFGIQNFIFNLIIFVFCYVWFIRYIRQIREIMGALIQLRKNSALNQPEKQVLLTQKEN